MAAPDFPAEELEAATQLLQDLLRGFFIVIAVSVGGIKSIE